MTIASVFATKKAARPSAEVAFASFDCSGCGNSFAVQASLANPMCVHCGCEQTARVQEEVNASVDFVQANTDPGLVQCSHTACATYLVLSSEIEAQNFVHCSVCGTRTDFAAEEDACVSIGAEKDGSTEITLKGEQDVDPTKAIDAASDQKDRVSNPAAPGKAPETASEEETAGDDDLDDIEDDSDESDDWEEDAFFEEEASDDEFKTEDSQKKVNSDPAPNERESNPAADQEGKGAETSAAIPGAEGSQPAFSFPSDAELFNNSDAKNKLSQETVQPDGTNNSNNRKEFPTKPVSLLDIVRTSVPGTPAIRIGRVEATLYVQMGDYTVAKLEQANVNASVREHFATQQYIDSITSSITIAGLDETLASFGFEVLTLATNDESVAALAQERIAEQAAALAANKVEASADELKNCMAIASVGFTKQIWATANPLRDELVASLKASGLRNPESIVDMAFASAGDSYNEVLIEQAFNLHNMDVVARNALATSITNVRHVAERSAATASLNTQNDLRTALSKPMQGSDETVASVNPTSQSARRSDGLMDAVSRLKARPGGLSFS